MAASASPASDDRGQVPGTDRVAERLRAERAEAEARLAAMTHDLEAVFAATADSNGDDEHDPEGQTIAYERSQLTALVQAAEQHLAEVDAAEQRLEQGAYGICEVCGRAIPVARLEARPTARTCVEHA